MQMSRASDVQNRIRRSVKTCRQVFWQANQDEINSKMVDEDDNKFKIGSQTDNEDNETLYRGKGDDDTQTEESDGGQLSSNPQIDAGLRSPRWFERIEQLTQENRKRSIQNQNLLQRVDFRTVWIARILIGLLVALIGSIATQALL